MFVSSRFVWAVATTLTLTCAATAAHAQAPGWAKIRVGVEGNYPPFSMLGADGQLTGFDIEIARALCAQMKAECTLVQQEWDGMIPALNARKFDMVVASMTISPERRKVVEFSDPYYSVPSRFIAKAGAFASSDPAAFKGRKIIVLRNSPRAIHLAQKYPESPLLLVSKETDIYLELAAGRGDIGFGSSVVSADAFLKKPQGKGYTTVGAPINLDADGGVGIAFRKKDTVLRDKVNAALKALRADGRYKALAARHFDFDISPN